MDVQSRRRLGYPQPLKCVSRLSVVSGVIAHMFESLDAEVAQVLRDGPSARSAAVLDALDYRRLSRPGQLQYVQAWEELTAWTTARPLAALAEFAEPEPTCVGQQPPLVASADLTDLLEYSHVEEVRLALNLSRPAAEGRVDVARALTTRMPATADALERGKMSYLHARVLVELLDPVTSDEVVAAVEAQVLPKADRPVGRFRRCVRNAVDMADPEAMVARHREYVADRTIKKWKLGDGMACLQVDAPAPDVATMWAALSILAGPRESDDPRSLGARRVDALLGLCLGAVAPDPDEPESAPSSFKGQPAAPVEAQVVVDLPTLLGLVDNPAILNGYGQIPAGLARDWLEDATTWRRLVTDPVDGHLLDFGPKVRSAPPKLRSYLTARHPTCGFPGCYRTSIDADLDHEPPWRADGTGGHTSSEDLRPLCRRHHRVKTFVNWRVEYLPDGRMRWISPSGVTFVRPPPKPLEPD